MPPKRPTRAARKPAPRGSSKSAATSSTRKPLPAAAPAKAAKPARAPVSAEARQSQLAIKTGLDPASLGASVYRKLDPAEVRRRHRGRLTPEPRPVQEWFASDVEDAIRLTGRGDLSRAVQLMRAAHADPVYSGVMESFCSGICRMPRRFASDDPAIVRALSLGHDDPGHDDRDEPESARSLFAEAVSTSTIAAMLRDGREFGVWLAEIVRIDGLDYPILVRRSPEFLRFDASLNVWTYQTMEGPAVIDPGAGQWLLGVPGGRTDPWEGGIFGAVGRAWATKYECQLGLSDWQRKFSGAARVATLPAGATQVDQDDMLAGLIDFHAKNTAIVLPGPGWDVKLLESNNGVGADSFSKTIAAQNDSMVLAVASQISTTNGSPGFADGRVAQDSFAAVLTRYARSFDDDINDQFLPHLCEAVFGPGTAAVVETVSAQPRDKNQEAQTMIAGSNAIKAVVEAAEAARAAGKSYDEPNIRELMRRYDIPTLPAPKVEVGTPQLVLLQGGADTAESDGETAAPAIETDKVADTALNGAQISSLVEIVQAVVAKTLPRDGAIAIIQRSFNVSEDEAASMLGSAGTAAFVPAPEVAV